MSESYINSYYSYCAPTHYLRRQTQANMNTETQQSAARILWSDDTTKETKFHSIYFKQVEHHSEALQMLRDVNTIAGKFEDALRTLTEYKTGCVVIPTGANGCTVVSLMEHNITQNPEVLCRIITRIGHESAAYITLEFDDPNDLINYGLYRYDELYVVANGSPPSPDMRDDHRRKFVKQLVDHNQAQVYNPQRGQYSIVSLLMLAVKYFWIKSYIVQK